MLNNFDAISNANRLPTDNLALAAARALRQTISESLVLRSVNAAKDGTLGQLLRTIDNKGNVRALEHDLVARRIINAANLSDIFASAKEILVVPFVFLTDLSLDVVFKVQNNHNAHKSLSTDDWPGAPADSLRALFAFVRHIDEAPDRHAFGFVYSVSDNNAAPVVATAR